MARLNGLSSGVCTGLKWPA